MLPTLVNHTTQNTSQLTSHTQPQLTNQPHTTLPRIQASLQATPSPSLQT